MVKQEPCLQNCTMCEPKVCASKGKKCDYIHKQYGLKKWVFRLILFTIGLGVFVPFASEAVCTIWFPDAALGLNTWNQFVGLILGIVATVLSIVSIIMSFKNYDDTLSVQEKYMDALEQIGNIAKDLNNVRENVSKLSSLQQTVKVDSFKSDAAPGIWENEPADVWSTGEDAPPARKNGSKRTTQRTTEKETPAPAQPT